MCSFYNTPVSNSEDILRCPPTPGKHRSDDEVGAIPMFFPIHRSMMTTHDSAFNEELDDNVLMNLLTSRPTVSSRLKRQTRVKEDTAQCSKAMLTMEDIEMGDIPPLPFKVDAPRPPPNRETTPQKLRPYIRRSSLAHVKQRQQSFGARCA
mmetsp:Transcript_2379/g.5476  ORF Transcript_2379/g.5476 Transcript_2379/m.5476 type:complete len:151 (+) Transcript_2379:94-546(+)